MMDAAYHGWLERVRPLSVYVVGVVVAVVLARSLPADAAWAIVAVSIIAPIVVLVRSRAAGAEIFFGSAGPRGALIASAVAVLAAATLALGAIPLSHSRFPTWSLFQVPPPVPRAVALALVVPNAIAAAIVFQGWLQTRIALVVGRWGAAVATVVVYALADRNPLALLIAIAPVIARAENGSLVACICAYVVLGAIAAFR